MPARHQPDWRFYYMWFLQPAWQNHSEGINPNADMTDYVKLYLMELNAVSIQAMGDSGTSSSDTWTQD